jgi:DNA invertase Pin-like site-specific DNA recombinase
MKALKPGGTVVVTKLDGVARSNRDLHNILHDLDLAALAHEYEAGEATIWRAPGLSAG